MSTLLEPIPVSAETEAETIPPLENGDRLTRAEFERRYHAMPHLKKAELIEGRVYVASPVRFTKHGNQHFRIIGWLAAYESKTPGVSGADNTTVRLDEYSEPQPDVFLLIEDSTLGQTKVDDEGYLQGAPELVVEVAASSSSYDLHEKREVYRRFGVREYLIWRVLDRKLDWLVLRDGGYEPLAAGADGIHRSEVMPGLWLDAEALVAGDRARLREVQQQGHDSPEHAEFVKRLADG